MSEATNIKAIRTLMFQLRNRICAAYTEGAFGELLYEKEVPLDFDGLPASDSYKTKVMKVVRWAEQYGEAPYVLELARLVVERRPLHKGLQDVLQQLTQLIQPHAPVADPHGDPSPLLRPPDLDTSPTLVQDQPRELITALRPEFDEAIDLLWGRKIPPDNPQFSLDSGPLRRLSALIADAYTVDGMQNLVRIGIGVDVGLDNAGDFRGMNRAGLAMALTALAHREGWLGRLLDASALYDHRHTGLRDFASAYRRPAAAKISLPAGGMGASLSLVHIRNLVHILQQLPSGATELTQTYQSVVANLDPPPPSATSPLEMVGALEQLPPDREGRPLLIAFAEALEPRCMVPSVKALLRSWLTELGRGAPALPALMGPDGEGPVYGVVEICPGLPGFVVRAWFCSGSKQEGLGGVTASDALSLRDWVAHAVLRCSERADVTKQPLVLEFVLHDELVNLEVDRWMLDPTSKDHVGLGTKYPVVIRSHWRAVNTNALHYRSEWREWSLLAASRGCSPLHYLVDQREIANLYAELTLLSRDTKTRPMSVALGFPPTGMKGQRVLRWALQAGAPVILWPRRPLTDLEKADLLGEMRAVAAVAFADVPQQVRQSRLRAQAVRPSTSRQPGRYLSVIYDDWTRSLSDLLRAGSLRSDLISAASA